LERDRRIGARRRAISGPYLSVNDSGGLSIESAPPDGREATIAEETPVVAPKEATRAAAFSGESASPRFSAYAPYRSMFGLAESICYFGGGAPPKL
jgi:hypothetical protein